MITGDDFGRKIVGTHLLMISWHSTNNCEPTDLRNDPYCSGRCSRGGRQCLPVGSWRVGGVSATIVEVAVLLVMGAGGGGESR
eukprot:scaffold107977_cov36-Cyclotella_meneghiniana.AAC.1